jgi:hypothetical protein
MLQNHYEAMTSDMRVKLGGFTQALYSKQQRREQLQRVLIEKSSRMYQITNEYTNSQRQTYEQQRHAIRQNREKRRAQKKLSNSPSQA